MHQASGLGQTTRPLGAKPSQGTRASHKRVRADGSQTGPGVPKGEKEEERAQGATSRMVRLALAAM